MTSHASRLFGGPPVSRTQHQRIMRVETLLEPSNNGV